MFAQFNGRTFSALMENKLLKAFLALVGALLVAAGFQGYSITFIPSGGLVGAGILTEVSLVYVISIGIERARQDIHEQRKEIDRMLNDVREVSREVTQAKDEVSNVRREVEQTKTEISNAQREIENASGTAQNAKQEIEDMKRSIERASRKF